MFTMISTVSVLILVTVLVWSGECQQCSELVCPGNGCLSRDSVCNDTNECSNGRGSYLDEVNCTGKIHMRVHTFYIHRLRIGCLQLN